MRMMLRERLHALRGIWSRYQLIGAGIPLITAAALLLAARNHATQEEVKSLLDYALLSSLVSVAAMAFICRRMAFGLSKPMKEAITTANLVASGDLTSAFEVDERGELGQLQSALYQMNHALATVVTQVRQATQQINSDTADIATGNLELSEHIQQQNTNVQRIVKSIDGMAGSVTETTDHARDAAGIAHEASSAASSAWEDFKSVTSTMSTIHASSKGIVDVIGDIESIAFQTNILAINAAVESARAGEQGRGFAVVAQEVRQLAVRSADTAKQVKRMISTSFEHISDGAKLVESSGDSLERLVSSVSRVHAATDAILAACEHQRSDMANVSQAVRDIEAGMSESTELVSESAAAADNLGKQTNTLAHTVKHFKLIREPRVNVELPLRWSVANGEHTQGTVKNISASGLLFETAGALKVGELVAVEFHIPADKDKPGSATQRISARCRVARTVSSAKGARQFGAQFVHLQPQGKAAFQAFMDSQLRAEQGDSPDEAVIRHSLVHIANLAIARSMATVAKPIGSA